MTRTEAAPIEAGEVAAWFAEHARRRPLPSPANLAALAHDFEAMRRNGPLPKRRPQRNARLRRLARTMQPVIAAERARFAAEGAAWRGAYGAKYGITLAQLNKAVDGWLAVADARPAKNWGWHRSARTIALLFSQALAEAGSAPRSPDPGGPLVALVGAALVRIGEVGPNGPWSADTISMALRGRRG